MSTVLFVGGGSMGHIAPSIAVAEFLKEHHLDVTAHFVCLPSQAEEEYIAKHGFASSSIDAPRLGVSFLWKFPRALSQAQKLMRERKPSVVFSKGGYVSVPVCLAAHIQKIPIVLHESDAVSGNANRFVGKWAEKICLGFPPTESGTWNVERGTSIFTGNPIRSSITGGSREGGLKLTGFSGERPVLLVTGGSQGAKTLNEAVWMHLNALLKTCDIIHLTGIGKANFSVEREGYWQREFVMQEFRDLYAVTDLALTRAGASNISELAANGIPSVLVPLRDVGHDHQYLNAKRAEELGGCVHLEQTDLSPKLVETVESMLCDQTKLREMGEKIGKIAASDASGQISKIISDYL